MTDRKHIATIAIASIIAVMAIGAYAAKSPDAHAQDGTVVGTGWDTHGVSVWEDPDTQCQYLLNVNGGITPRYARGGSSYEQQHVKGCRHD